MSENEVIMNEIRKRIDADILKIKNDNSIQDVYKIAMISKAFINIYGDRAEFRRDYQNAINEIMQLPEWKNVAHLKRIEENYKCIWYFASR